MQVRVVVFGRNYHWADSLPQQLALPEGGSVEDAIQALEPFLPDGERWPDSCLVSVSGTHLGTLRAHTPRILQNGDELLLLMPVAGG